MSCAFFRSLNFLSFCSNKKFICVFFSLLLEFSPNPLHVPRCVWSACCLFMWILWQINRKILPFTIFSFIDFLFRFSIFVLYTIHEICEQFHQNNFIYDKNRTRSERIFMGLVFSSLQRSFWTLIKLQPKYACEILVFIQIELCVLRLLLRLPVSRNSIRFLIVAGFVYENIAIKRMFIFRMQLCIIQESRQHNNHLPILNIHKNILSRLFISFFVDFIDIFCYKSLPSIWVSKRDFGHSFTPHQLNKRQHFCRLNSKTFTCTLRFDIIHFQITSSWFIFAKWKCLNVAPDFHLTNMHSAQCTSLLL